MGFFSPPAFAGFTGSATSKDGTTIAFDRSGGGPAVIPVDGVGKHREYGPTRTLARPMRAHGFTVYAYDRRGRGASTDTAPYAGARETADFGAHLDELIAAGRLDDAQALYMTEQVRILRWSMPVLRRTPSWRRSVPSVPSLSHDVSLFADLQVGRPLPTTRWDRITAPTLVVGSARSPTWLRHAAQALVDVLPGAHLHTIAGLGVMVKQEALAPVLADFFTAHSTPR